MEKTKKKKLGKDGENCSIYISEDKGTKKSNMKRMWKEKPDRSRECFIRWEHLLPTGGLKYAPGWVSNPATIQPHPPTQPEPHPGKAVKMSPSPNPLQTPQHIVPGLEMVPISHCAIFLRPAISVFWKSNASWPFYIFCCSPTEAAVWKCIG